MSPELIGALVTAVIGLIAGITGILSKRSEDQRQELEQLRKDFKAVRLQLRYADQWIYRLTRSLDQNGIEVPPAPQGLDMTQGEDQ